MPRFKQISKHYKPTKRHHWPRLLRLKQHPFIVPVTTFLVLFFFTGVLFIASGGQTLGAPDSRIVQLSVDGQQQIIPTRASTVGDLLQRLNITLRENDVVEPSVTTPILDNNFHINVYRAKPVTIEDGGRKITVLSAGQQPREIVEKAGITLDPADTVKLSQPALNDGVIGQKVVVDRATPAILNLYGNAISVHTHAHTVADLLLEKKIKAVPGDTVQPNPQTPLTAGLVVYVEHFGQQVVTTEEIIPAPVQTLTDASVPIGTTVIRQAGSDGKKLVTYQLTMQNGKEVSRQVLQEVVEADAVPRIIVKGTQILLSGDKLSWLRSSGIAASDYQYVDYVVSHESGWRPYASNGYCAGLGQACPSAKLATVCPNWQVDPVCQLDFFSGYAQRYGGWAGAASYWSSHHYW